MLSTDVSRVEAAHKIKDEGLRMVRASKVQVTLSLEIVVKNSGLRSGMSLQRFATSLVMYRTYRRT